MEKVLRKKFRMSRKARFGMLICVFLFLVASGYVYRSIHDNIQTAIMQDAEQNVTNIGQLNADSIYKELYNRSLLLQSIADNLTDNETYKAVEDKEFLLRKLRLYAQNYNFYNMGILTLEGTLYTTTGRVVDVSETFPYSEALNKPTSISESFMAADGGEERVNLVTAAVYDGSQPKYIITGTYRSKDLAESLNISAFNKKGFSYLVDSEGRIVVYSEDLKNEEYQDLMKHIDRSEEITPETGENGAEWFRYKGSNYYAHYDRIDINDWYLMTCAKEEDVFAGTKKILSSVFKSIGFWFVQVFLLVFYIVYTSYRNRIRMQEIVFDDPLLHEKNFEYLGAYFPQLTKEERERMALVVMDVDKFKEFNYIYGSKAGDDLLKYISRSFRESLPGDEIYRHSADQFAAVLFCESGAEAKGKMVRLLGRFALDVEKKTVPPFEMSSGVCMLKDYDSLQVAYSDALLAKNTVKKNRVQKCALYGENMKNERLRYMEMEADFRDAVRKNEFKVFYQPKFDMRSGEIVGAEALVRWIRKDGTIVSPGEFIPCFEASGQIIQLDEFMLENVCRQMKQMELDGLDVCQVSVNLSRVHLKYQGIADKIADMVYFMEIDPGKLAIEVTESALYEDNIPLRQIVSRLHELGCEVNIDDYGTGISSPSSLANIEFDVIKLDKSFIDRIGNARMESVIRSTISLAADLGMRMIAEGVEEREQAQFLMDQGCNFAQGFYYSRPVPEEEYRKMLAKKK